MQELYINKKKGVCRYSITNADAVIKRINLVNGKFRSLKSKLYIKLYIILINGETRIY